MDSVPASAASVSSTRQYDLFGEPEVPSAKASSRSAGLFAEIVFNRPLDHTYTYFVPEELRDAIGPGKRVLAPFGKGDRVTTGFCVQVNETGPDRKLKEVVRVLDE